MVRDGTGKLPKQTRFAVGIYLPPFPASVVPSPPIPKESCHALKLPSSHPKVASQPTPPFSQHTDDKQLLGRLFFSTNSRKNSNWYLTSPIFLAGLLWNPDEFLNVKYLRQKERGIFISSRPVSLWGRITHGLALF